MKKNRSVVLSERILRGLASLICLENEVGYPLSSNKKKQSIEDTARLEYQDDCAYLISDPRINFIKQILRLIFRQRNYSDDASRPYAFRLKHLKDWLVRTAPASLLTQMAWACKANCKFCFQKGNPPFLRTKCRTLREEIKTRLRYFDAKNNLGLVGKAVYENDEVLNNPYIADILKELRKKAPNRLIEINTNGTSLVPEMVKMLASVNPILIAFSLNSADSKKRKWMMEDPHADVAISSLPLLREHKIPFIVSVVVWPGLPFSDIEKTIHYAEKNDAYLVRLSLPGYTKFFSREKLFDAKKYWTNAVKYFYPKLNNFSVPVLIVPNMFVQYLMHERVDLPKVMGVVKNSPAINSGVVPTDLIKAINGHRVVSIEEAVNLLKENIYGNVTLIIERNETEICLEIKDRKTACYPYGNSELRRKTPFGIILTDRYFSHDDIKDIGLYIILHDAKNVLVVCSAKAHPYLKYYLEKYNLTEMTGAIIKLAVAKNDYFGGTIDTGDLLVVEDFIRCIKKNIKRFKPDLVLLPSSPFSIWERDLIGRVNLDIERETGITVEFISNGINQLLY